MNRSMVRVSRVVVTLAILGVVVGGVHPAGAQEAPSLVVTPSTGLLEGQEVAVSGSGFAPNGTAYVSTCQPGAVSIFDCEGGGSIVTAATDAEGSFAATYLIRRFIYPIFGGITDCALVTCVIGATDVLTDAGASAQAPIELVNVPIPVPTLAVTPSTGLVDGQTVEVTGSDLRPNERVDVQQCGTAFGTLRCNANTSVFADATGAIRGDLTVSRVPLNSNDCATVQCTVRVSTVAGSYQLPIDFAIPQLTIVIDPYATLRAGTNDAVAQATISCDIATPIYLYSNLTQPGVSFRYSLNDRCSPSEPLVAFLPSRRAYDTTNDYSLGPANLVVGAFATVRITDPATEQTQQSASVQLIDYDDLVTAIQAALADPANTELRAQIQQAIVLRFAQDPVFRAEFIALLNNAS